jgi:hypothetical protein
MKRLALLSLAMSAAWVQTSAQTSGIRPRPDAASYPAKDHVSGATIAAIALSPAQVKAVFGTDSYKGYIVLEVAVYPDSNSTLNLSPKDFMLKIGATGEILRSSAPSTVALSIDEKNNPSHPPEIRRPVDVTTTSTIGYDSAGAYNPNTGKTHGVVYTATQVDVAPGGTMPRPTPQPGNKGRGFDAMEAELSANALPEETVSRPVAGYLYFPAPKKKASGAFELDYSNDTDRVKLSVPPPR